MIWDDYRNAMVRRATIQAGATNGKSISGTIPSGSALMVPVFVPVEQTVSVAPSPVENPQIGATVDVRPDDRFSKLARLLQDVEAALDDVDAVHARIAASVRSAQNLCTNLSELHRSMVNTTDNFTAANQAYAVNASSRGIHLTYDQVHEGEDARSKALDAVADLVDKALEKLYGQPVWLKEYPTAESDLTMTIGRVKDMIKDATMMGLVVDLVPTVFAVPMSVRRARLLRAKRTGMACLNYICHLAARAAVAIASSPKKADWDSLQAIVGQTKQAGSECADLIEYACACTRGFDATAKRPMSSAPFSCLGVVSTLHAAHALEEAWTTTSPESRGRQDIALRATGVIFNNFDPLFKAAGLDVDVNTKPEEWVKALKDKTEAYSAAKESIEGVKGALELSESLKDSDARRFLGAIVAPFDKDEGPLRELIPKSARSFYSAFQTLWDVATKVSKTVESSEKDTIAGWASANASAMDAAKGLLEGAKALEFFEENGAALEMAEDTIALLGRATFILTIVAEGFEAYQAAEKGKETEALGHAALAGSAFCLLVGSGVTGAGAALTGGVIVAVGAVLLVGGVVATKGELLVSLYVGETVMRFEAIFASDTPRWAKLFEFDDKLNEFKEAFEAANFAAGAASGRRVDAGRLLGLAGP